MKLYYRFSREKIVDFLIIDVFPFLVPSVELIQIHLNQELTVNFGHFIVQMRNTYLLNVENGDMELILKKLQISEIFRKYFVIPKYSFIIILNISLLEDKFQYQIVIIEISKMRYY